MRTSGIVILILVVGVTSAARQAASPPATQPGFDEQVRSLFFRGFGGDTAALAKAMDICEKALATNPQHAEALVWHGSGLVFQSGSVFQSGDFQKGIELWSRGLREMDEAVAAAPDNVAVLIPRGAALLETSRHVPKEMSPALLEKGLADYEKVLTLQGSYFATISSHARGELLFGLAEGWLRAGNTAKARSYFERIVKEASGSGQVARAQAWLKSENPIADTSCIGCHGGARD